MVPINKLLGPCTRRDLLRLGALGALGYSVSGWLDVVAGEAAVQEQATRRRAKACIVLFMSGGPAHTFTFDIKTGDKLCPYKAIETSAPGIQISEYLPEVAKQMHHLALVRGMSTGVADHEQAHYLMRTGFRQQAGLLHPHMGSVVASQLVREEAGLPNFILLKPGSGGLRGAHAGFLNPAFQPLILKDVAQGIANLKPAGGDMAALKKKAGLLDEIDQGFLDEYQADAIQAKLAGYRKAVELMDLDAAKTAFQIDKEPQAVRDLYGDTPFGRQCLGARRLIEHGVRFVEVMHPGYWDTHGGADKGQKNLSEVLDRPMAALLSDLKQRGLLDETLVVWMGEFGRTPNGNDHYAKAWTTAFAGAGVKGGRAIGRTDAKGATVEDRPVTVHDFVATIYQTLGINTTKKHWVKGRPIGLVDAEPKPLNELFA
jgi:uncharacterized protein (DUF1501 family)